MIPRRLIPHAVAALVCAAALVGPASAGALDPQWLAPQTLDTGTNPSDSASQPVTAGNRDGDFATAWVNGGQAHASVRRAGAASWSDPQPLGTVSSNAQDLRLVSDAAGRFVLSWHDHDGAERIRASTLGTSSDTWSDPATISGPEDVGTSALTALADGSVAAAWVGSDAGTRLYAARRTPAGDWQPSQVASADDTSASLIQGISIAADSSGLLTAVYVRAVSGHAEIRSVSETGPGSWGSPATVDGTPRNFAGLVYVVATPDGSLTTSWTWTDDPYSAPFHALASHRDPGGGSWDTPVDLTGANTRGGALAVDEDGDVIAALMGQDGGYTVVTTVRDSATGTWSAPETVTAPGTLGGAQDFAHGPGPELYLTYKQGTGFGDLRNRVARFDAASNAWEPAGAISDQPPALLTNGVAGIDPAGNLAFTTQMADGSIVSLIGDNAGPLVGDVTVPATLVAGENGSFSASATDVWSALGTTGWDFGDGDSGSGDTVTHTFSTPGTYTVTATVRDSLGFATPVTRTVTVTAAPATAPAPGPATPPAVQAPVIEARLTGRTVTLNTKVALKPGQKCKGTVKATTAFGGKTYTVNARLAVKNGACRATATIKLLKTPSLRTKLRVTVSGKQAKTRTITTRRG